MLERRSLKAPITLGVVMIVLVVVLTIVWILYNFLVSTEKLGSGSRSGQFSPPVPSYCWGCWPA